MNRLFVDDKISWLKFKPSGDGIVLLVHRCAHIFQRASNTAEIGREMKIIETE